MKNIDSQSNTTGQSSPCIFETSPRDEHSYLKLASELVDEVSDQLYKQISNGDLLIDDYEVPLQIKHRQKQQRVCILKLKEVDPNEHKLMMKRFMRQNSERAQRRRLRSLEQEEKERRLKQQRQKSLQQIRNKSLEKRRSQIQRRLAQKKQLVQQISKSILQSSEKVSHMKRKKFLYQTKQQQFHKKYILPKLQEQKLILEKKKSLRIPLDISEIREHQKNCDLMHRQQQKRRRMKTKMDKSITIHYNPPTFVPQSFKMVEQEQFLKEKEEELRRKQIELNQIRKQQFVKRIDQIQIKERETFLGHARAHSTIQSKSEQKTKSEPKLERQDIKNLGNSYLRDILKNARKISDIRKLKPIHNTQQSKTERKLKNTEQIQQNIKATAAQIQKLRMKKISQLLKSDKLDKEIKYQKLRQEIKKLDKEMEIKMKEGQDLDQANMTAIAMVSSIHAKIAYLNFAASS